MADYCLGLLLSSEAIITPASEVVCPITFSPTNSEDNLVQVFSHHLQKEDETSCHYAGQWGVTKFNSS